MAALIATGSRRPAAPTLANPGNAGGSCLNCGAVPSTIALVVSYSLADIFGLPSGFEGGNRPAAVTAVNSGANTGGSFVASNALLTVSTISLPASVRGT